MHTNDIFDLIEKIAATSKKKEKERLLTLHKDDFTLQRVLTNALNPLRTYGIGKVKDPNTSLEEFDEVGCFTSSAWSTLDQLAARQLTGNEARATIDIYMGALHWKSAQLFKRILLKDLRAGFSAETVNKVWPGLINDPPYMRCSLPAKVKLNEWSWSEGVYSQIKADGMFVNLSVSENALVTTTRPGHIFSMPVESVSNDLVALRNSYGYDIQCHGELVVHYDNKPLRREVSNGILNSISDGGEMPAGHELRCFVWDCVPLSAVKSKGKHKEKYKDRFNRLKAAIELVGAKSISLIETKIVFSKAEAISHYMEMLARGLEGTVIKEANGPWMDGTSKYQVKLKLDFDVDLVIVGFNPGEGKNAATFGSLICETSDGLLRVNVSGFKDPIRKLIHENRDDWLGAVITVRGNDLLEPSPSNDLFSIFLPRFIERRTDKFVADTLDKVKDEFEAAKNLESK